MALLKSIGSYIPFFLLVVNCSSTQKLQEQVPIEFDKVYYQKWTSGVNGGGSGLNVVISISESMPENIQLDSVYFRGKGTKLQHIQTDRIVFIGRFKSQFNQKEDIIMSSDPTKEYGNQLPDFQTSKVPFELNDDECVLSYQIEGKTNYYKIKNLMEKPTEHYPSAPTIKQ